MDITLSKMTCAGSHLVPRIRHLLLMKKVEKVEKVKHFWTIHTLQSLPDEGGDVCKVWFWNVNLYKVQTNKLSALSVEITNKMQPCNRIYYSTVY